MLHAVKILMAVALACFYQCTQAAQTVQKPTLTIYTYQSFISDWGPGAHLKRAFETLHHCTVNFVAAADSAALLNRLRMESGHNHADLVLGLDGNQMIAALQTNLFTAHGQSLSKLDIPGSWSNKTFLPVDYSYFTFVYDAKRLKNPPTSLTELINRQDLTVIYPDPRTSTVGQGLVHWIQSVYQEKSAQAWQKLAKHTRTVPANWSTAYSLFLKNEVDLAFSYTTSVAYHLHHQDQKQVQAAIFTDGHIRQVELMAQLKNSQQPKLAQAFLNFMLTKNAQEQIMLGNWMYPVISMQLPPAFATLPKPTPLVIAPDKVQKLNHTWLTTWRNAMVFG